MASVAKLSRDRKKRNAPYYIQFHDHEGKRRTTKGCSDKGVTEAKAAQIETLVQKITLELAKPSDLDELLGKGIKDELVHYLSNFRQALDARDNTKKHVQLTMTRVRTIVEGCEFKTLKGLNADAAEQFLKDYCTEEDLGHRTFNHYLQALDAFGNWLAHPKRKHVESNPFAGIRRRNAETDVRHPRRALTAAEFGMLLKSARESGVSIQCFTGEERARIYTLSYFTGLRKGEVASLTPASFDLDSEPATLTVEAKSSKRRKRDTLPLHPELTPLIREWTRDREQTEPLFPKLGKRRGWLMVKKDLERVGIAYQNEAGIADFHAAGRHTHITELLKSGVKLVEAKELARHSDVRMTMKYTHIGLEDQAKAVRSLPCLHIVCSRSGGDRHIGAKDDISCQEEDEASECENPCESKGFDAFCQPMATDVADQLKVEAAGIEPASRDISVKASTCVANGLSLACSVAYQQGYYSSQPGAKFNSPHARHGGERSGIATGSRASPANPLSQGNLI